MVAHTELAAVIVLETHQIRTRQKPVQNDYTHVGVAIALAQNITQI